MRLETGTSANSSGSTSSNRPTVKADPSSTWATYSTHLPKSTSEPAKPSHSCPATARPSSSSPLQTSSTPSKSPFAKSSPPPPPARTSTTYRMPPLDRDLYRKLKHRER
ncbi:hypothetical protein OIY81_2805 [Cryptosporidium canis]|nr:hypothetical protein OIY81_2805 [Cryptosporidium canis]